MLQKLISIVIPYRFKEGGFQVWMQRRESSDELNGMLEFPGGKIEVFETPDLAAQREVQEEVGVTLNKSNLLFYTIYSNKFVDKIMCLNIFFYHDNKNIFPEKDHWFNLGHLDDLEKISSRIPPANLNFLRDFISQNNFKYLPAH